MAKTNPSVELFYAGGWHDITATEDVYTRDPIQITRGRGDQISRIPPGTLSLSIKNVSGKYSPRAPMSPLYGLIGRNTPVRLAMPAVRDTFSRTVTDGWGNTDTGQTWQNFWVSGTGADFDVAAGVGTHVVDGTVEYRGSWLLAPVWRDVEVTTDVTMSTSNVTGGALEPGNIILRAVTLADYYLCRVQVDAAEAVSVSISKLVSNVETNLVGPLVVPGLTHTGQTLRVRAQAEGWTLSIKVWAASGDEPFDWHLSTTDGTFPAAGRVGLRSGVGTGNTNVPVTFSYDNFTVRLPRIMGEVESWPQRWNVKGTDVWAPITANGIMRRFNAPGTSQRVLSAIASSMLSVANPAPLAYYPLNDGTDTTSFSNLADPTVSGTAVTTARPGDGGELVSDVTLLGFTPDQTDTNNAFSLPQTNVVLPISKHTSTGGYTVTFWHRFILPHPLDGPTRNYHESINNALAINPAQDPTLQDATTVYHRVDFVGGGVAHIDFRMQQSANRGSVDHVFLTVRDATNTSIGATSGAVGNLSDGNWHEIQGTFLQNGAVIDVELFVDGIIAGSVSTSAAQLGTAVDFGAGAYGGVIHPWIPAFQDETWAAYGLAHVSVHNAAGVFGHSEAANGYAGEVAGRRIERLCGERGVTFANIGDLDATVAMGPQRLAAFLDLLQDGADADHGILYETRSALGLTYRTRATLYNQDATVALSYSAGGEVAPELAPVEDTNATANDITVTRSGGASANVVQETGPLNVQEPGTDPDSVGRYPKKYTLILATDDQPVQHASWFRHLGTCVEARYPVVNVDLTAMDAEGKTALIAATADLNAGDRFTIANPPAWIPPDTIVQHAQGFTETIESHHWTIATNATPALPYEVLQLETGTGNRSRIPTGGSTLAGTMTATSTSRTVTSPGTRWIDSATYPAQFPFDIMVAGERMTVTAIVGTTSPQTFTVTRSVNGVVKAHAANEPVQLFHPPVIAL